MYKRQLLSYENQVNYYTNYISENPLYEYAGTYADEGISGTNTKKRDEQKIEIEDYESYNTENLLTRYWKAIINEISVVIENIEDYLEKRHQELIEE